MRAGSLRAAGWFFFVRCSFVAIAATPFGLALRMISGRQPDGDDALLADLVPRLGDVALREPRTFGLTLGAMALALLFVPLGEAFVDRVGAAMVTGLRWPAALAEAARDPLRTGAVSVLATVLRGFALACVYGLVRHEPLTTKALALPVTVAVILGAFVSLILAVRDCVMLALVCLPGGHGEAPRVGPPPGGHGEAPRVGLGARFRVALLTVLRAPLRLVALAASTRVAAVALGAVAFVASTSPTVMHGGRLFGLYALVVACTLGAALVRALRFAGLAALTGACTDARSGAPGVPSLDPGA